MIPYTKKTHTETATDLKKFEKLHSDKFHTTTCPHRPASGEVTPSLHQSKPCLTLNTADWKSWTFTDGSCHIQEGGQGIEAGVYHPSTVNSSLVEPYDAGITNSIGRAELAATAAAIAHGYNHSATDSLTSLHQISKQLLYPEKHRHHVQGDVLEILSNTICNSQSHTFL